MASSAYGRAQPPWVKPPRTSSSARPGACITPSRVRLLNTITLPIRSSSLVAAITLHTNGIRSNRQPIESAPPGFLSRFDRRAHGLLEVGLQAGEVLHPLAGHHDRDGPLPHLGVLLPATEAA